MYEFLDKPLEIGNKDDGEECSIKGKHSLKWIYASPHGEFFYCDKCFRTWRHSTLPKWYKIKIAMDNLITEINRE